MTTINETKKDEKKETPTPMPTTNETKKDDIAKQDGFALPLVQESQKTALITPLPEEVIKDNPLVDEEVKKSKLAQQLPKPGKTLPLVQDQNIVHQRRTMLLKQKNYGKGQMFLGHPDLQKQWIESEFQDYNTLNALLRTKAQREGTLYSMRSEDARRKIRLEIMKELAEEGSELYKRLQAKIRDNNAFYKLLEEANYKDESIRENLENYTEEARTIKKKIALVRVINFDYVPDIGRFMLHTYDDNVDYVQLSEQICYVMGYEHNQKIKSYDKAKYAPDLRGGVSHICVYIHNLYDDVMFGDSLAPLLQVVTVSGKPGDIIEKRYDTPMFSRVKVKEVDEIGVELKTLTNRHVPFGYGVVICILY
ncbi:MAG TPA: hypothetical protein VFV08_11560, partial [Puia sp.]|nr:hypothetical protein [Puia sp.]